jgi:hypothetical protein
LSGPQPATSSKAADIAAYRPNLRDVMPGR